MSILKLSFLKTIRNKKYFLFLILFIGFLVITASLTYKKFMVENIQNIIEREIGYRTIIVNDAENSSYNEFEDYNINYKKILKINHVVEIYNFKYYIYSTNILEYENSFVDFYYGSQNTLPKNIIGRKYEDDETGVAICSKNFYPFDIETLGKNSDFINQDKILNSILTAEIDILTPIGKTQKKSLEKSFKVVGLYDPKETDYGYNSCFLSPRDMKDLYTTTYIGVNGRNQSTVLVVVDDLKNVTAVLNKVKELGFHTEIQAFIDYDYIKKIYRTCDSVVFITCLTILILTILFIKKVNYSSIQEIGIQKSLGLNKKKIVLLNLLQIIFILIISLLLGILTTEILYVSALKYFNNYLIINFYSLEHYMINYCFGIIIILIVPILVDYFYLSKGYKKDVTNLLEG